MSPSLNGIKTEDLSLNSSRTRRRRESLGLNGRNSSSDESSPQHRRRMNDVKDSPFNEITKKKEEKKPKGSDKIVGSKKDVTSNEVNRKRSDSFILDIHAIMGSINITSGSDEEEDPKPPPVNKRGTGIKGREVMRNGCRVQNGVTSPPPPVKKLDPPPAPKSKTRLFEGERKDTLSSRTAMFEKESKAKEAPLPTISAKPPLSPHRASPKSFKQSTREESGRSSIFKRSSAVVDDEDRRSSTSPTPDVMQQKKQTKMEKDDQIKSDYQGMARSRANALASVQGRRTSEEKKEERTETHRRSDQFEESPLLDSNRFRCRTGSTKDEGKVKRSSSFKLQRQMSGDKALGMFYHNRRSQMLDHDSPEDAEKRLLDQSLERSGSFSSPQTPVASRSTRTASREATPLSPLMKTTSNHPLEVRAGGGADMMAGSSALKTSPKMPLSPRIAVTCDDEESDVSAC